MRGRSFDLAKVVTELFRRMETTHPLIPQFVSDTPAGAPESAYQTEAGNVSRTAPQSYDGVSDARQVSDCDRRVLELHQSGIAKREIARRLGMAESTVRSILQRLTA